MRKNKLVKLVVIVTPIDLIIHLPKEAKFPKPMLANLKDTVKILEKPKQMPI